MLDVLVQAGCFVAIIVMGFALRRVGLFRKEDVRVLSRITLNITMPAAVVANFAGKEIDGSMFAIILIGLGGGILYMLVAYLINLRGDKGRRAFEVLNLTSYNVGCFAMPFIQSFFGPLAVITTSLFDTGNAFVTLGGSYGFAVMIKNGRGFSFKRLFLTLVKSVPLMCYVLVIVLNLVKFQLPDPVLSFAQLISGANAFCAMLMIGIGFEVPDKTRLGRVLKMVLLRYGIAAALACAAYFLLPFTQDVRSALVLLLLSPVGSSVPAYTQELGEDVGLASAINSASIVLSVAAYVILLPILLG